MDRKRLIEARNEVALEAWKRWAKREPERTGATTRYTAGGPQHADKPERARKFAARETLRAQSISPDAIDTLSAELIDRGVVMPASESLRRPGIASPAAVFPVVRERKIGPTLDFTRFAPDEEARGAGRPVARIVEMPQQGILPEGFGTGFLVSPRLLLTNHHVLPTKAEAYGVGANFQHEYNTAGLQPGVIFELDPDTFYVSDKQLDFALVGIKSRAAEGANTALDSFGFLRLIPAQARF